MTIKQRNPNPPPPDGFVMPKPVRIPLPPALTAAPGLSARVLGGTCAACGKPRDSHGAPAPGDPLGCTGVPFSLSVPEAMVTIRKPASLGHTAALPPVEEPQWVTCDCLRTAHLYSGSCRGVVRSVPAPVLVELPPDDYAPRCDFRSALDGQQCMLSAKHQGPHDPHGSPIDHYLGRVRDFLRRVEPLIPPEHLAEFRGAVRDLNRTPAVDR
jgi:hypothetical protein